MAANQELGWIADVGELKQEIVTDLAADKWLLRDAERAVEQTFNPAEDYSANYGRALQRLKYWKQSGGEVKITTPIKKIQTPTRRPEAGLKPAGHPAQEPVAMRRPANDLQPESIEGRGGTESAAVTKVPKAQPHLPRAAVQAEGATKDRAHIPTHGGGLTTVAPSAQTPPQKETPMAKLCKCGCGSELRADAKRDYKMGHNPALVKEPRLCACGCGGRLTNRHPYIKGHQENPQKSALPSINANANRPLPPVELKPETPQSSNGHSNGAEKSPALSPIREREIAGHVEIPIHIHQQKPEPNGLNGHTAHSERAAVVVNCQVSEYAMDLIWSRMLPQDKARLLFPPTEPA